MSDLIFGNEKYELLFEPQNEDGVFILERLNIGNDEDECLGMWNDIDEMLMDIDYSSVGEEITLNDWQKVCDWAQNKALEQTAKNRGHSA